MFKHVFLIFRYLSNTSIIGELPVNLGMLTSLVNLYASRNYLTGNLTMLENLRNLTALGLVGNRFTGNVDFLYNLAKLRNW